MAEKLFPPYLNAGSYGAAVDVVHMLLYMLGFGGNIVRDRCYGPATATAVQYLQAKLGCEIDGNFGPATRAALKAKIGIDVDAIPTRYPADTNETVWVGPDNRANRWPSYEQEETATEG